MMNIEDIVKQELAGLKGQLESQISDPAEKAAVYAMTQHLAMIPIRLARGEDVTIAVKNLQAEAALRGVSLSMRAQAAVQQAWMNIIFKILGTALVAAI